MADFFKKISFLSLLVSLLLFNFACYRNIPNNFDDVVSKSFFNDFENESYDSIWKNVNRLNDTSAYSGFYVSECKGDELYSTGFKLKSEDFIGKRNALINIDMMLKSAEAPSAYFVISVMKNNETVLWKSFPLSENFINAGEWYKAFFELNVPNDIVENSELVCYVLNEKKEHFLMDDIRLEIDYYNIPSFVEEIDTFSLPNDLVNIFKTDNVNVLYSKKKESLVIADEKGNSLTRPLSLYFSLIIDGDTVEMQTSRFKDIDDKSRGHKRLLAQTPLLETELLLSRENENKNLNFHLKTVYEKDVKVLKSSLIMPFLSDDFTVYRRNPFVDTCDFHDVYYLDQEGFSVGFHGKQLNLYHPDDVSSIQLDVRNATAYINTDFYYDHLLMRYQLSDSTDCYVDNSPTFMKKGKTLKSSFVISLTNKNSLPRVMPVPDGYESAIIWTEHADWSDIRTHRATYFGSEDIVDIDDAIGGFAFYDIPVTKSVFYDNPDSVTNYEKNTAFPGLHSTIKTDSSFFYFLKQLDDRGFDICLHTPEQYTTTRDNLAEALSFMKEHFASPSWIDHGYNNGIENNREDMVCDGLDSTSSYYAYDLWKANGVRYLFNASYEEMKPRPFVDYVFENNLIRPYPGYGDALPLPKVSRHPSYPDVMLWSTPYTLEPGGNDTWEYYMSQEHLDKITDFRYVLITHIYAPWVSEERGFWENRDGMITAKEGFNKTLARIAEMRDRHLMLPTTIADYMKYQSQLKQLEYRVDTEGKVILKNNNNETIKGLSLISVNDISLDDEKSFEKRKTQSGDEWIIWFDMEPNEEVEIVNNY